HAIGNLVIAHELPDGFVDCREQARTLDRPYFELQREMFGFDYAEVSAELLRRWNLSAGLVLPIMLHTRAIGNLAPEDQADSAVVSIAATTARAASYRSADSEPVPDYDSFALTLTGIDADAIEDLMTHVDDAVADSLAALLPDV
ncbi:MAG: HDOD domain-containing protein, partial [Gammaproteobacteria bacterium]